MPAKPKPKPKTKSAPKPAERGELMTGAEVLVKCMEREGVDLIFAYPGGASMPIHQALTRSKQIRTVLPRHEQGGSFAAEGYARVTGKAGVCGKKADTARGDIEEGIPAWKGMVLEAGCFRVISGQIRGEVSAVKMNPAVIIDHRVAKLGHGHV